jgi:hypothetical protein
VLGLFFKAFTVVFYPMKATSKTKIITFIVKFRIKRKNAAEELIFCGVA